MPLDSSPLMGPLAGVSPSDTARNELLTGDSSGLSKEMAEAKPSQRVSAATTGMAAPPLPGDDSLRRDRAKLDALEITARPPTLTAPPDQAPHTDLLQAFGQPAMWLAVFGSLLTRRPMASAIMAASGVLKATNEADAAQAKQAFDTWKVSSDNALKLAKFEQDAYKAAIDLYGKDAQAGLAQVRTLNMAYQNQTVQHILETEGWDGVAKYFKAHGRMIEDFQEGSAAYEKQASNKWEILTDPTQKDDQGNPVQYRYNPMTTKATTLTGEPYTPGGAQKMGGPPKAGSGTPAASKEKDADTLALQAFRDANNGRDPVAGDQKDDAKMAELRTTQRRESAGVMSDEDATLAAQVALKTGHPPATLGRSQANISKFFTAWRKEAAASGMSAADIAAAQVKYAGELSESRTLGTTSARIDFAARELDVALPQALELSEKVYRPGFKAAAAVQQAIQGQTSDPDLLEFAQQNQAIMNAYAQAMRRGGASTVDSMERAEKLLSTATTQQGYIRQLDRLHKEVQTILYGTAAAKQGLMNEITGRNTEAQPPTLTGVPRPGAGAAPSGPSPEAIQHLRDNPSLAPQFDEHYGPGSAQRALGQ